MNFKMEDGWRETSSFLDSYYHSVSIIHSWGLLISTLRNQTQTPKEAFVIIPLLLGQGAVIKATESHVATFPTDPFLLDVKKLMV